MSSVAIDHEINDYRFDVREEKMKSDSGLEIPGKALIRTDTDQIVGVVKGAYKVLTHKDALDPILEVFDKEGLKPHKRILLTKGGSRMYAQLSFSEYAKEIASQDVIYPGVTIINSLDGSRRYEAQLSVFRLVCRNGLIIPASIPAFRLSHSIGSNFENAVASIDRLYADGSEVLADFVEWNKLPGPVKHTDLEEMKQAVITGVIEQEGCQFPLRYAEKAAQNYKKEKGFTMWNLYNAFNSVLEHDLREGKGKIERARQLDENLYETFAKIAKK